jgi:hypothetical protein
MIGIIAVAPAVGITPLATVRVPAMVRAGRYRPTGLTPARDADAPAGEPVAVHRRDAAPSRLSLTLANFRRGGCAKCPRI